MIVPLARALSPWQFAAKYPRAHVVIGHYSPFEQIDEEGTGRPGYFSVLSSAQKALSLAGEWTRLVDMASATISCPTPCPRTPPASVRWSMPSPTRAPATGPRWRSSSMTGRSTTRCEVLERRGRPGRGRLGRGMSRQELPMAWAIRLPPMAIATLPRWMTTGAP